MARIQIWEWIGIVLIASKWIPSRYFRQEKHVNFCFLNLENGREDKNKPLREISLKLNSFYTFQIKLSISTFVFIFSAISQILKTKFHEFWSQTRRNLESMKFANYLNTLVNKIWPMCSWNEIYHFQSSFLCWI